MGCALLAAAISAALLATGPGSALRAADTAFDAALAARDGEAFLSHVAEDAVFGGRRLLVGRAAIREGWSRYLDPRGPTLRWRPTAAGVATSGDLGWTTGEATYEWREKGVRETGLRYLTVWRRSPDGRWLAVLDGSLAPVPGGRASRREVVRTVKSSDGSLEASIGTWERGDGPSRTTGTFLTVRARSGDAWATVHDAETPSG